MNFNISLQESKAICITVITQKFDFEKGSIINSTFKLKFICVSDIICKCIFFIKCDVPSVCNSQVAQSKIIISLQNKNILFSVY